MEHVVAAKAVSFKEVLDPAFKEYATNVIKNSKAMADVFLQDPDFRIISGGTENHLFLVDVTKVVENGKVAQNLLDEVNITLNKNSIPYETLSPSRQVEFVLEQQPLLHVDLVKKRVAKWLNSSLKPLKMQKMRLY